MIPGVRQTTCCHCHPSSTWVVSAYRPLVVTPSQHLAFYLVFGWYLSVAYAQPARLAWLVGGDWYRRLFAFLWVPLGTSCRHGHGWIFVVCSSQSGPELPTFCMYWRRYTVGLHTASQQGEIGIVKYTPVLVFNYSVWTHHERVQSNHSFLCREINY